jgi:hypothetical protein
MALAGVLSSLAGCATLNGAAQPVFDQGMLNVTWYGTYHRPLDLAERATSTDTSRASSAARPSPSTRAAAAPAQPPRPAPSARTQAPAPTAAPGPPPSLIDPSGVYHPEHAAAYVRAVYELNETPIGSDDASIVDLYRHAQEHGSIYHSPRPAGGDLVFFHNTWDRNADGRTNDWFTHVGVVESVDNDGTIAVLNFVGGRVGRLWMNLEQPDVVEANGQPRNTELRRRSGDDNELTQYTAGALFAGFASLLDDREQVLVLDRWTPPNDRVASR